MKNSPWIFLSLLWTSISFAQSDVLINFNWKEPVKTENGSHLIFDGAGYNTDGYPIYTGFFENKKIDEVYLSEVVSIPLPTEWSQLIKNPTGFPSEYTVQITNKIANSGNYAVYEIFPFRINNGVIEIIQSITAHIELSEPEMIAEEPNRSTSNSVLANGRWLKVGIYKNGIHKISYNDLLHAGLINASVNSNHIQLFGNGGRMLSEKNSDFRYDDLTENAIKMVDGGDGNFDLNDYFLFYGEGTQQWSFNWADSNHFSHINNVYADTNFYFVTVGTTNGLRLSNRGSLGGTPTYTTSTGDGYTYREDDVLSLTHSGRQWAGDYFNFQNSFNYNFDLENADIGEPASITVKAMARCVACNTTLVVKNSGMPILTLNPDPADPEYNDPFATPVMGTSLFSLSGNNLSLSITKTDGDEAWLDYIEINYRKNLIAGNGIILFSDKKALGNSNVKYVIANANTNHRIWDITNPLVPIDQDFFLVGGNGEFQANMSDTLHHFVIFDPNSAFTPASFVSIGNQNLHSLTEAGADFIIITHPSFLPAAQDLADFHTSNDGMTVHVVTTEQIYNEYSSGKQDISAIRDFIKMYYDKNPTDYPKYALLFGDGSYDYKPYLNRLDYNNTNFVPAFETNESLNRNGLSFCSDDFFALLDNNEGSNGTVILSAASNIDIGIGRIPARSLSEAQGVVNKIKYYASVNSCMKDWRNIVTLIADDMEMSWEGGFLGGSEDIAHQLDGINKVWNIDKIYLDSYQQVSNAGQRYPDAEIAIFNRINKGSLIVNYIGHGGETGITAERVIQIDDFVRLVNENNLPVFVTMTCTFTRFDNPAFNSAGEVLMQQADKGAIALFSTIRPIAIVDSFNAQFYDAAFTRLPNGEMPRLGDIMYIAKRGTSGGGDQIRNILLFGDPALRMAYPQINVITDSINGFSTHVDTIPIIDTLMASQLVTISGHIEDLSGNVQELFNGDLYTTIFDKASNLTTLGNDGGNHFNYQLMKNVIFKGKSTVTNGHFKFEFKVPLDINYLIGEGKISYYASDNNSIDANGYYTGFSIGSSENNCNSDNSGPEIELFINDTNFQEMGITQSSTSLLVKVADESGINTTGLGIGHDLQAIIDGDIEHPILLNDYYLANNNSYSTGFAEYYITGLSSGFHVVNVQAWDGCNNPSEAELNFTVTNNEAALINFQAYPNPFSDMVTLAFEHNFEGKSVIATVDIVDLAGQTIKTYSKSYIPEGNREVSITWDGRNDSGEKMASGMYICRIHMQDEIGNQASNACKIVLVY